MLKHKNTIWGYKRGSKTKSENKIYIFFLNHWTFEACSTGLQRRFPLDFRCTLHWTFNFRCFDKGFVYKMFWHKNTIWGYKKRSKTKSEKKIDPLDFRGALNWTFNCRCFDRDLCIKCFKNIKIQFEVTKRGQNQNQKIKKNIFWPTGLSRRSPLDF